MMYRTLALSLLFAPTAGAQEFHSWRGPHEDAQVASEGPQVPTEGAPQARWTHELAGRGTAVAFGDQVVVWGYEGKGQALHHVLQGLSLSTGEVLWQHRYRDFLSDIIYDRYAIGAPTIDPRDGRIFVQLSDGRLLALAADGSPLWTVSMMEDWGRLTFPNGRTGSPVLHDDLVIVHGITAHWGKTHGPGRDRFYAFHRDTGDLVWMSAPGERPVDSSWSTPVHRGADEIVAGTGCGHVVSLDPQTGARQWRARLSDGGVNVTVALGPQGEVYAAHAKEDAEAARLGGSVRLDPPDDPTDSPLEPTWHNAVPGFSSSPLFFDGLVWQVTPTGVLTAIQGDDGTVVHELPLATDQLHASSLRTHNTLWVPTRDGQLHQVGLAGDGPPTLLGSLSLPGNALGAPSFVRDVLLVHTTQGLYAWGEPSGEPTTPTDVPTLPTRRTCSPGDTLQLMPMEVQLVPGGAHPLRVRAVDAQGRAYTPSVAPLIQGSGPVVFEDGELRAAADALPQAGVLKARVGACEGTLRYRIRWGMNQTLTFDDIPLDQPGDTPWAYPPGAFSGAKLKWRVQMLDGEQVLARTTDKMLFQRAVTFMGPSTASGYRRTGRVRVEGNRRSMASVGFVNGRYRIALKGSQRRLEVSSNQERFKEGVPFTVQPDTWYQLLTDVIPTTSGTTIIRVKAWPDGTPEPADYTLVVDHAEGHTQGAPGIYGFAPQNLHTAYVDDLRYEPHPDRFGDTPAEESP